jgi:hypothetical protein
MTCELTPRSRPGSTPDRVDDRYRLIRVLGRLEVLGDRWPAGGPRRLLGVAGSIWLAEDELLWRRVAIQRLDAGTPLTEALARLHPVKVFNVVEWDGRTWIVMEAAIGVARPVGPRAAAPRANALGWRGRAPVPSPTSRNRFDR